MDANDIFLIGAIIVAAVVLLFAHSILPDVIPDDTPLRAHKMLLIKVGCYISAITLIVIALVARQVSTGEGA